MKSIKEWTLRYWVVVYLVFIIVLGLLSNLFGRVGVDIHPDYIFSIVFLMNLIIAVKSHFEDNLKLKNFILFALIFSFIKISVDEWCGYVMIMDILFKLIFIVGIVWLIYYRIKRRKVVKPEVVKKTKELKMLRIKNK